MSESLPLVNRPAPAHAFFVGVCVRIFAGTFTVPLPGLSPLCRPITGQSPFNRHSIANQSPTNRYSSTAQVLHGSCRAVPNLPPFPAIAYLGTQAPDITGQVLLSSFYGLGSNVGVLSVYVLRPTRSGGPGKTLRLCAGRCFPYDRYLALGWTT